MKLQLQKHPRLSWMVFALSLGVPLLFACGNPSTPATLSSSSISPALVTVVINPLTVTAAMGGSQSFLATVKGAANTSVTWSVQEGTAGGSITSFGVYTAPNTLGTYHVVATSVADATVSALAVVTIQQQSPVTPPPVTPPAVSIAITPPGVTVAQGDSFSFSATVTGAANNAVRWSIREGLTGGSINGSGLYTAPTGVTGTFHVIATSVADATVSAVAAVGVEPPPGTANGAFTSVGNMITGRVAHTATLLGNGKVLIAGGFNGYQDVASAELYDPSTRTFSPTGSMMTPREGASATLQADGRVLIAGGQSNGNSLNTEEIYDPSTGVFTATSNLTSTVGGTLLPDGRFFVAAGGYAEIYDPHSGTFTPTGPYADPSLFYVGTATLLSTGKILVNGCDANFNVGFTELFDPQSGTFSKTGPMTLSYFPDFGYTATLLADGRVLFVGSDDFAGADFQIYDTTAGTFSTLGSRSNVISPQVSTLTDGTVLIAGGELPGGNGSRDAELFVPSSNMLEYVGAMTVGRQAYTAIALPDDTVLITGGFTSWSNPNPLALSSAEIYKPQ